MRLEELIAAVSAWAETVFAGESARLRSIADASPEDGVTLRVVGLKAQNIGRNTLPRRDPIVDILEADILLTFRGADATREAVAVEGAYFAALEDAPFVIAEVDVPALMRERGLAPALGFVIRGRVMRERVPKVIPLVREAKFDLRDRVRVPELDPARRGLPAAASSEAPGPSPVTTTEEEPRAPAPRTGGRPRRR